MIENPWALLAFVGTFGDFQDYGSMKQGLDDALLKLSTEQLISSKIVGGGRINLTDNLN